MNSIVEKPNIQDYHDYLEFLRDWIEYLKDQEKGFSLRKVAKEAGMASGYLSMCFSGKRILSKKAFDKIKPYLNLNTRELKYLELLRVIADSEISRQRVEALNEIQKMKDYRSSHRSELEVHQYLSHWYNVAIREMVNFKDFQPDPGWIQERLRGRVSQKEIEDALLFLVNFGFIQKDENGTYSVVQKQLDCHEGVFKISLGEFHRQMLDWAKTSIDEVPRKDRLLMGRTAVLSPAQFKVAQEIIIEAVRKIEDIKGGEISDSSEVYHIELAAFPLSKKIIADDENVGE